MLLAHGCEPNHHQLGSLVLAELPQSSDSQMTVSALWGLGSDNRGRWTLPHPYPMIVGSLGMGMSSEHMKRHKTDKPGPAGTFEAARKVLQLSICQQGC